MMNHIAIIMRKKILSENSIEGLAETIAHINDVNVIYCPEASNTIRGMIKNIIYIRKFKLDVAHLLTPAEAYLLPFLRANKTIITYHDLGTILSGRNKLYAWFRAKRSINPSKYWADSITFVSSVTRDEYINYFKLKDADPIYSKFHVIYNPYNYKLHYYNENNNNEKFVLLQIGTSSRKNLESTIRAIQGLNIKLDIVGKLSDDQVDLLERCNTEYENSYDIEYNQIINKYSKCNAVCFPSFYEGFGLPIIEANVMRKPIIASDIPVLHEVGADAALYVNPHSTASIRSGIIQLMSDSALYDTLVLNGIKNSNRFSTLAICKQYHNLYLG